MLTRAALPVYLWLYRNYWIYRLPFRSSWFISTLITLMMRRLGSLSTISLLRIHNPFPPNPSPATSSQANRKWAFRSRSIVTITDDCRTDGVRRDASRVNTRSTHANEPSNLNPLYDRLTFASNSRLNLYRFFLGHRWPCSASCVYRCVKDRPMLRVDTRDST